MIWSPASGAATDGRSGIVRRALVLRSTDLRRRVVSGATYTFLGIFLRAALTIGSMTVLARLLTPADFGHIAMATVVTEFAALFANFGFVSVLVQKRRIRRIHLDTVFWASAMLGAALTIIVFLLSYPAARFYGDPLTGELLRLLCITFIFGKLGAVHGAILTRLMQFRTVFLIESSTVTIRIIVAVTFAWQGYGVWGLVAGSIAGSLAHVLLNLLFVPYVPRFRFHTRYIASTIGTSSSYFGGGLLFYINANIDLFFIGRALGATALGYYQNARSLTDEVRSRLAIPLQRVLFPAYSSIQNDQGRLQRSVLRSGRLISAVVFAAAVGISAVSEEIVPLLYGPQWLAMIPVVKVLGLGAALRGASSIATPIFNAGNRVGLALIYNTIGTSILTTAVIVTMREDIQTVANVIALTSLYSIVTLRAGFKLIGLGSVALISMLGAPVFASSAMWGAITALRVVASEWIASSALLLLLHVAVGAAVYCVVLLALSPSYFADFWGLVRKSNTSE